MNTKYAYKPALLNYDWNKIHCMIILKIWKMQKKIFLNINNNKAQKSAATPVIWLVLIMVAKHMILVAMVGILVARYCVSPDFRLDYDKDSQSAFSFLVDPNLRRCSWICFESGIHKQVFYLHMYKHCLLISIRFLDLLRIVFSLIDKISIISHISIIIWSCTWSFIFFILKK